MRLICFPIIFVRRTRFIALITLRDLSEANTRELLDGIDDAFIHKLFSPGIASMISDSAEKGSFPIDREVAVSIVKDRRLHPFTRPDMPYPVGITATRIAGPYLAGSVQTASLVLSGVLWKYYGSSSASFVPATSGTLLSFILLMRSKLVKAPPFAKQFPKFPFRSLLGGIDPVTIGLICKYRKFSH